MPPVTTEQGSEADLVGVPEGPVGESKAPTAWRKLLQSAASRRLLLGWLALPLSAVAAPAIGASTGSVRRRGARSRFSSSPQTSTRSCPSQTDLVMYEGRIIGEADPTRVVARFGR